MRKMFWAYIATIALAGSVWAETGKICREYWIEHSGRLNGVKKNIAKAKAPTGRDTLVSFETVCWKNSEKKKKIIVGDDTLSLQNGILSLTHSDQIENFSYGNGVK